MDSEGEDPSEPIKKMPMPLPVAQWVADRFLMTDETGAYYMKSEGETKYSSRIELFISNSLIRLLNCLIRFLNCLIRLMTSILWLILHLNGQWRYDYQTLTGEDWDNKHTEK